MLLGIENDQNQQLCMSQLQILVRMQIQMGEKLKRNGCRCRAGWVNKQFDEYTNDVNGCYAGHEAALEALWWPNTRLVKHNF